MDWSASRIRIPDESNSLAKLILKKKKKKRKEKKQRKRKQEIKIINNYFKVQTYMNKKYIHNNT